MKTAARLGADWIRRKGDGRIDIGPSPLVRKAFSKCKTGLGSLVKEYVYAEIMTGGTHSSRFSGRQRIRNEATERYTSGLWRTRQRQDYSGALLCSITSLVSRDIGSILKLSDEPTDQFNRPNDNSAIQWPSQNRDLQSAPDSRVLPTWSKCHHEMPVTIEIVSGAKSNLCISLILRSKNLKANKDDYTILQVVGILFTWMT